MTRLFLILSLFTMTLDAHATRFFIGTYNGPSLPGIFTGILDAETGRLGSISPACSASDAQNPSFLALSPDGKRLYACLESKEGAVAAFRVETSGTLALLNAQAAGGAGTCHVSVAGGSVFAANYSSGSFAGFKLTPNGALEPRSALVQLSAMGPNAKRQQQSHAHAIYPVDGGARVYGCDLGGDHIEYYRNNGDQVLAGAGRAVAPAGSGPRHLAFSANGMRVYCCNELDSTVTIFSRDANTGALSALQTISFLPEGLNPAEFTAAEIVIHPNGKWTYVSTRDITKCGRDKIARFNVASEGSLSAPEIFPAGVMLPRSFDIDPSGRWMIVAGQGDNRVVVLGIDPETGALKPTDVCETVQAPVCVLFAR